MAVRGAKRVEVLWRSVTGCSVRCLAGCAVGVCGRRFRAAVCGGVDDREMAQVQGGRAGELEALGSCDDGSAGRAGWPIGTGVHEFGHARQAGTGDADVPGLAW